MPYVVVLLPMLAFCGVVGAIVNVLRGRPRSALVWGLTGIGAAVFVIALEFSSR